MGKRSPHEATCPRIASGSHQGRIMSAVLPILSGKFGTFPSATCRRARQAVHRRAAMTYAMKPLSCDPGRIRGMSERMIVSHYENNYGGAVKRLNLIEEQLAGLDYA